MADAIIFGYCVKSRLSAELDFVATLVHVLQRNGRAVSVKLPVGVSKFAFDADSISKVTAALPCEVHLFDVSTPSGEEYDNVIFLYAPTVPSEFIKAKNIVCQIETYGGFDFTPLPNARYFPKSKFSFLFNAKNPMHVLASNTISEIGPIWHSRRDVIERGGVGFFGKNSFFIREKAKKWTTKKRAERYFHTLQDHMRFLIDEIENLQFYLHPNDGSFLSLEVDWLMQCGVDESHINFDLGNVSGLTSAVGFNTHARADLNWFGVPFIEITDIRHPLRNFPRGLISSLLTARLSDSLVSRSSSFPMFYGAVTSACEIKGVLSSVAETSSTAAATRVGELLLGPNIDNQTRAEMVLETLLGKRPS